MAPPPSEAAIPFPERPFGHAGGREAALIASYRRLAETLHDLLSEESLEQLLEQIANALADLVPHDFLTIYQADDARRELVPVLARTQWREEVLSNRLTYGRGITG